ncbi:MAG: hypothetical protein HYR91_07230 [Flavobacteriia bacterium]|nr:hypothetical protein [Flavobacteriia bacterium]
MSNLSKDKTPLYLDVHRFYGNAFLGGIAYQFNLPKKSDYKFSSYKISL